MAEKSRKPKDKLVRFGVAMEESLLVELDAIVAARGSTRSEAFRDIARAMVSKAKARSHVEAVGALTLVYDHHVRDLTNTLTAMQHDMGDQIRSAMHLHLTHEMCLEVIVLKGWADELQASADRILGTRGVSHGGIEIFALGSAGAAEDGVAKAVAAAAAAAEVHARAHAEGVAHVHRRGRLAPPAPARKR